MRQRSKIAVSVGILTLFLCGYVGISERTGGQASCDAGTISTAGGQRANGDRFLLAQEALCVVTAKARQTFSDAPWSNDPAEMYVHALPPDGRRSAPANGSNVPESSRAASAARASAEKYVERKPVTGNGDGAGIEASANDIGWLIVAIPVGVGAVTLVLAVALIAVRHRRRRTTPHAAFLNMAGYSPVVPASTPASAPATEKRRAA
jgi:hypothetical protein